MVAQYETDPEYVDDPFGDKVNPSRFLPDELHLRYPGLLRECLETTGRTYIRSSEVGKWRKIDKQLAQNVLDPDWIENQIEWARKKGVIKFPSLVSAILNEERYQDWQRQHSK